MGRVTGRRTFFSFHYGSDLWRVNQIRNSGQPWLNKEESYGFWDASLWESVKQQGDAATEAIQGPHQLGSAEARGRAPQPVERGLMFARLCQ